MRDITGVEIHPTQNVQLLVYPFGKYEFESVDGNMIYLVDSCGGIFCSAKQVRVVLQ